MVAARKIRAADRAGEQHVADEGQLVRRRKKDYVSGRVTGTMAHFELAIAKTHTITVVEPLVGHEALAMRKAERAALFGETVDPELIARMRTDDRQLAAARQLRGRPGVIDV